MPLYVWMPPYFWTPHMFGCPLYVLIMFGCPLYIHNTKKACFARLMGCPYAPIHLDAPTYVWMPPVCLDIPHMFGHPHMFGFPLYVWMMFGCLLYIYNTKKHYFDLSTHMGAFKHTGAIQTYRGVHTNI